MLLLAPASSYGAGDVQDASTLARRLVCNYGMAAAEAGLPTFAYKTQFAGGQSLWQRLSAGAALLDGSAAAAPAWDRIPGPAQLQAAERAVDSIIKAAHEANVQLLQSHRGAATAVQVKLLASDTVSGKEIEVRWQPRR